MGYEIRQTQYRDPDQKSGQHTNGPANIFVREDDTSPWYAVIERTPMHRIRNVIAEIGLLEFQRRHCAKVGD